MKRLVYASSYSDELEKGFLLTFGKNAFFLVDAGSNITTHILRKFVNAVCDARDIDDDLRARALEDKPTLDDFRRRISKATLQHFNPAESNEYYSIQGRGFTMSFPPTEFEDEVIVL